MSVRIISDSACDILPVNAKEFGLEVLPLLTSFGEETFLDGVNMNHNEFFAMLETSKDFPKTGAIAPYVYEEKYKEITEAGDEAVVISLSSNLSSCYQNALLSAEDYDNIYVVDSLNASLGQKILVMYALKLRDEGKSAEEIKIILEEKKKDIKLLAVLGTLENLKRGGRISLAKAFVGGMLHMKPVVAIDGGEVKVLGKARGLKNGFNLMTEIVTKLGGINFDMPYTFAFSGLTTDNLENYLELYADDLEVTASLEEQPYGSIGCAIGTHIGPGAVGIAFFSDKV